MYVSSFVCILCTSMKWNMFQCNNFSYVWTHFGEQTHIHTQSEEGDSIAKTQVNAQNLIYIDDKNWYDGGEGDEIFVMQAISKCFCLRHAYQIFPLAVKHQQYNTVTAAVIFNESSYTLSYKCSFFLLQSFGERNPVALSYLIMHPFFALGIW